MSVDLWWYGGVIKLKVRIILVLFLVWVDDSVVFFLFDIENDVELFVSYGWFWGWSDLGIFFFDCYVSLLFRS